MHMYNAISPFLVGFQLSVKQQSKERRSRCIKIEVNASTTERIKKIFILYSVYEQCILTLSVQVRFTSLAIIYRNMKPICQGYTRRTRGKRKVSKIDWTNDLLSHLPQLSFVYSKFRIALPCLIPAVLDALK